MKNSQKTLATILIGFAAVIGIVSIFCFFGSAIVVSNEGVTVDFPSMFKFMFGIDTVVMMWGIPIPVEIEVKAGWVILFVIEAIVLLLSVVLLIGGIAKKFKPNAIICLAAIIALLTLVAVILSFCTKKLIDVPTDIPGYEYIKLAAGPISYGALGIIGVVSNVIGIILYKKEN